MEKKINNLTQSIESASRIFIIGRGSSVRFFDTNSICDNDLCIGFNINGLKDLEFHYCYVGVSHKKEISVSLKKRIDRNIIDSISQVPNLFVGSVQFELGYLLHAVNQIASSVLKKKKVYLFGFDFQSATPDDDIEKDQRVSLSIQRTIDIESQLLAYNYTIKNLIHLEVRRSAFDFFADLDPRTPIEKQSQIDDANSNAKRVEIVAELTTNHFGDLGRLKQLIKGAYYAGADAVKLQCRNVETFYSKDKLKEPYKSPFGRTFGDYRMALELSNDTIEYIIDLTKDIGLKLFFSALDKLSYDRLRNIGQTRIKLPSTISEKRDFLLHVAHNPVKEIVISTGMTTQAYEEFILENFGGVEKLYLLHCVSSYPTSPSDTNFAVIKRYTELSKEHPNLIPGYSSHDIGEIGSIMALASGALMLEKHIKIGTNEWAHFDDTAMDVNAQFPNYVNSLRRAERMMGSSEKRVLKYEHHKY